MIVDTLSQGVVELQHQKQASKVECGRESARYTPCPEKGGSEVQDKSDNIHRVGKISPITQKGMVAYPTE